ncbi:Ldh family oxidoreductase [Salipiger sp. H15]|uniref:Ldh family oxidoreductase n=1 Tax=Alloyangia sp. H15 TaxID=3029062 RepID=A0AAU8AMQ0_9RHOB
MDGVPCRVAEEEARALARDAFLRAGLPPRAAEATAGQLVLAEMMGITTHGLNRVKTYIDRLARGVADPAALPVVERPAPALLRVDGRNALGTVVMVEALSAAMEAARATGIAAAFCRHSTHFGAAAPYCHLACEAGFAAIVLSNATPVIPPAGGREARLGNNPIAVALPDPGGAHVIFDAALSVSSRSAIRRARDEGRPIPPHWATDRHGAPTTDAQAALSGLLLPIGGTKGAGLALSVDLLAGVLSGAGFLDRIPDLEATPGARQDLGHVLILIDADRLLPAAERGPRLDAFRRSLCTSAPLDPAAPVRLPSDRARAQMARAKRDGLPLPAALLAELRQLAAAPREGD